MKGRKLVLLVIDDEGSTHQLSYNMAPSGDEASFSVTYTVDASSIGPLQVVMAIASDAPLATFENFRPMPVGELATSLSAEWDRAGASLNAGFFKLTK